MPFSPGAMQLWSNSCIKKTGCKEAHIDQFASEHVVEKALARKNIAISLSQSHRGESDPVIAAASILARNAFITGLQTLSNTYHIELPKGAGSPVLLAGKRFLCAHNKEALDQVAKMHFKTAQEILQSADYKMNENQ